ncbi:hypothetical protein [uncultured Thiodictyon sp.]|uniref:DUF7931 domain-containing protein n=2 Tax=uncultured Thiodictyon sp. TaxID=1846217 RepID=UPI0025E9BB51|nr:hypothetical protein [uncultured Thiodictyon sp.]
MTMHEDPPPQAPDLAEHAPSPLNLGGAARLLTDRDSIRAAGVELAAGARHELLIFSPDLEPDLYDRQDFLAAVRQLALARPWHPVRILVGEPQRAVNGGHRLIELSRRLSSRIAIRRVAEDFRDRADAFLIADGNGYCLRRRAERPEAVLECQAPGPARRLRAEFEQIWEHSDEDTELRRLYL